MNEELYWKSIIKTKILPNSLTIAYVVKAYNIKNENTIPIKPLTSHKLNAINDHLIKVFTILGLRLIPNINDEKINPTPTATPVKHTIGTLEAKYLNPIRIMVAPHLLPE